jgi:hypothetical protein
VKPSMYNMSHFPSFLTIYKYVPVLPHAKPCIWWVPEPYKYTMQVFDVMDNRAVTLEDVHMAYASAWQVSFTSLSPLSLPEQLPPEPWIQRVVQSSAVKGRPPSSEDWEAVKPVIQRLYIDEKKTGRRVLDMLRIERNFFATYAFQPIRVMTLALAGLCLC